MSAGHMLIHFGRGCFILSKGILALLSRNNNEENKYTSHNQGELNLPLFVLHRSTTSSNHQEP